MRRAGGRSVQGYNAQIATTGEQVIIATDLCQAANDSSQLEPMIDRATTALRDAGIEEPIGTVLADGGYWNAPQIAAIRDRGIDVLVPTKSATRTAPRTLSARQGDEAKRIEAVLETSHGRALYRRRQQIVEPVFAHTKFLRGITRFHRRRLAACRAEWNLIAATHNLLKLYRLAPGALSA